MERRAIIAIVAGCGCLCLICVAAVVAGVVGLLGLSLQEPQNVDLALNVPAEVSQGESFTIIVEVENLANETQSLNSVDFSNNYLEGISLLAAQPAFTVSYEVPLVDFQSYTFNVDIPAGETLRVRFEALALRTGDFSGGIDVCINSEFRCASFTTRTVVLE